MTEEYYINPSRVGSEECIMSADWIISESQLEYQEQLGYGGDGEVYRVLLKTKDGRTIQAAAKRFRENKKESELESQKKELDFLRQLRHPNIVQFFYAVLTPLTIIVTEYASKGSLYEYLKRQTRLPKAQVLEWARQISRAVQYLQKENVVHRDIKSSNIVITADDTLKLCDFGIAKRQRNTEKTNHERGTISWMPPEAFVEKLSSKASDIYSLGIVIWELVSCKLPYQGRESLSILYAVKVHKLRPEIPAHCPTALKSLLEKCWKENRKKRPDIGEVLHTIEGLMEKEPNDNVQVDFTGGRKEIYHLYQEHLALENKQNALTEVNIPIEHGVVDATTKSLDIDSSFDHMDNMTFFRAVKNVYGRCIGFILAFIIIGLTVIGLSALLWHLLGDSNECTLPEIDHVGPYGFRCDTQTKFWSCRVSCEDGYIWTGGDDAIVCDETGSWNISTSICKKNSMKYMEVLTTAKSKGKLPDGDNSRENSQLGGSHGASITGQGSGKTTSTDSQNDKYKEDQLSSPGSVEGMSGDTTMSPQHTMHTESEPLGPNHDPQLDQSGTNQRSSTKLPKAPAALTTNQPMTISTPSATIYDNDRNATYSENFEHRLQSDPQDTGAVYRLVLSNVTNADDSLNATIYRDTNDTSTSGTVEICLPTSSGPQKLQNCTEVIFLPNSTAIVIKFAILNPSTITESNQLPSPSSESSFVGLPVEFLYSQNNETNKEDIKLPFFRPDAHVVFNVLTNEGG